MTTYQCRDCGYAYGHMTPSPLAIAGHRQSEHGEYHGLGAPITAQATAWLEENGYQDFTVIED